MWTVTVPGSTALQVTYGNGFSLDSETQLSPNILTIFDIIDVDLGLIMSQIYLTGPVNGTVIQCGVNGGGTPVETVTLSVTGQCYI